MSGDEGKTRAELLAELAELRRRLAAMEELEAEFKRTEAALRESEERFALFMRYLPGAAYLNDREGNCLYVNRLAANALGLETEGVQARSLKEIFPESLATRLVAENEAVLVDGLPLVYQEMLPEDSGRYWLTCKFPIPREGKPSLIGGISLEITQQRQDQEALRESQERFRAFFESAAAGMAIIGLDGKPREVNPAFCQFLGYEREALLNSGFLRFTHPEEVEDSRRVYEDIRAGRRQSVDHERRFVRGDGAVVWGHVRGTWMRDSRRQRTYWVTVVEDITARKQAEVDLKRALTEAEDARDKIDSIISSVSGGLIVADPEEKVILVNEAVEGLLGIPSSEALGKPMSEIFRDRSFLERFRELTSMRLSGFQADLELPVDEFEGPRTLRTRASVMQNKLGWFTGTVTILYDVTRERKLDRLKSEFISTAAHELHTPLAVLMGYSELLLHPEEFGEFSPEMKREFLGEIYEKCEALASLVDDLLDISRIESGREIPLMILPTDFRKTVEKVVNRFRMNYRSHSFRLKLHSGGPNEFLMDEKKMIQVLENLLSNAVKYSPQGGPVLIEGKVDGNSYRISVTDRGIGMTGEQLEKVFEKFYRADSSNTAVRGLGLGMSIAKNIVEAHGGLIWAESRPQEGTRVFFTLPFLLP